MKKSKLFLSMLSLCFALAVLCFGVYAANQVNYSISGNITYTVEDCYVYVNTSVYKSTRYMSRLDVRNKIDDASEDITAITQGANLVLMQDVSDSFDTLNNSAPYELDDLDLSFSTTQGSEAYAYFFVINVKKMAHDVKNCWVAIDDELTEADNTYIYDNMFVNVTEEINGSNLIVALALDDQTASIDNESQDFSFGIRMETGDIALSEWNLNKLDLDELENGNAKAKDTNIIGLVVIPSTSNMISGCFLGCESLREVYLSEDITQIPNETFAYCYALQNINIENITSFGENCFDSTSLVKIIIKEGTTIIPDSFFIIEDDPVSLSLAYVSLPSTITSIGNSAFQCCENLTTLIINKSTPPTLVPHYENFWNNFEYCDELLTIYVPQSSVNVYKSAEGWSTYADKIQAINC